MTVFEVDIYFNFISLRIFISMTAKKKCEYLISIGEHSFFRAVHRTDMLFEMLFFNGKTKQIIKILVLYLEKCMSVISRFKTFLLYSLENRLPFLENKNKQIRFFSFVARIRNFLSIFTM